MTLDPFQYRSEVEISGTQRRWRNKQEYNTKVATEPRPTPDRPGEPATRIPETTKPIAVDGLTMI